MKTVSLIIPFYNTHQEYFGELINALSELDKNIFQIILVNDGSDNCDLLNYIASAKLKEKYSIIDIKHSGVSSARNAGLNLATQDYTMFIDSDDLVNFKLLKDVLAKNPTEDIIFFKNDSSFYKEDANWKFKKINKSIEELFAIDRNLPTEENYFYRSVCSKLIKTELARSIKFFDGIVYCEDCLYCCELYKKAKTFTFVDGVDFYFYRQNTSSQTRKFDFNFSKRYEGFFKKFLSLNSDYASRINFLMYDTIAIYLNVRICMAVKRFHWKYAFEFVKSFPVKTAATYFLDNPTKIQPYRLKICRKINNRHYFTAICLIVFNRFKVKIHK